MFRSFESPVSVFVMTCTRRNFTFSNRISKRSSGHCRFDWSCQSVFLGWRFSFHCLVTTRSRGAFLLDAPLLSAPWRMDHLSKLTRWYYSIGWRRFTEWCLLWLPLWGCNDCVILLVRPILDVKRESSVRLNLAYHLWLPGERSRLKFDVS